MAAKGPREGGAGASCLLSSQALVALPSWPQLCPLPTSGNMRMAGLSQTLSSWCLLMGVVPCVTSFVTGFGADLVVGEGDPIRTTGWEPH